MSNSYGTIMALCLVLDQPHQPTGRNRTTHEHGEAERAETHHHARLGSLRNAEDNRRKQRKQNHRSKMRYRHDGFLPFASECASTAATTFSSPATTMNLVP